MAQPSEQTNGKDVTKVTDFFANPQKTRDALATNAAAGCGTYCNSCCVWNQSVGSLANVTANFMTHTDPGE